MLRDSLGLSEDAPVLTVRLFHADGVERFEPDSLVIEPGFWADFRSDDSRPRSVRFQADSVSPAARGFLSQQGDGSSPPLLAAGAHWLVDFSEAPPGRYPFVVEGTGASARGVVVVRLPETPR